MKLATVRLFCFACLHGQTLSAISTSNQGLVDENIHPSYRNAFHIFNAIHSSMRQWGSSLNHNGMSFFPATVPAGTELFHGTGTSTPIEGMEWLAFEPEHAQQFAHGRRGRGAPSPPHRFQKPIGLRDNRPLPPSPPDDQASGFLHTYRAKRDLNLLYIDGMSAGKTQNGTLDTQDCILLDGSIPHGGFWEVERAQGLCNISRDEWDGRVDGFLRMEAGFEIILCHFERDLEVKSINRAYGECQNCEAGDTGFGGNLKYLRAVADRYHGIGGGRVRVNYEKMVTAFALHEDIFRPGESGPRLTEITDASRDLLRKQVGQMILSEPSPVKHNGYDWQAIADMIVTRYSSRLQYLTMPDVMNNEQRLNTEINAILSSFIDYDNRSQINETAQCASRYMAKTGAPSSLAAYAITFVSHYICHKLVSTQYGDTADNHEAKKQILRGLIEKLNWTTWKECGTCDYDKICSIPIWPFGSEEDWITPTCRNATTIREQHGYWGIGGPGGGHHGPPPAPTNTVLGRGVAV